LHESDISPLSAVKHIVQEANWYQDDDSNERLVNALKLFWRYVQKHLARAPEFGRKTSQSAKTKGKIHTLVENLIDEFIQQSRQISDRYRLQYAELNQPIVREETFLAYTLVDEYSSLLIEESATELFQLVSQHYEKAHQSKCLEDLNEIVELERSHRLAHGYSSILKPGDANEVYAFRASVLKKYVSSILHLFNRRPTRR